MKGYQGMTTTKEDYNHRTLPPGTMLQEYRLEHILGHGSFGIVYVAKNTFLPETVAIKEFLPEDLADRVEGTQVVPKSADFEEIYQEVLYKFLDEARTLFELAQPHPHPNIVRVLSVFKHNNTGYMVMEYEDGQPLSNLYKDKKRFSQQELEVVYYPIMDGLAAVHEPNEKGE